MGGFQIISPTHTHTHTLIKAIRPSAVQRLRAGLTQRHIMKIFLFRECQLSVSVSLCAKTLRMLLLINYCCYQIRKTTQDEIYVFHIRSYKEFTSACNKMRRCTEPCVHQSHFYIVTAISTDSFFLSGTYPSEQFFSRVAYKLKM